MTSRQRILDALEHRVPDRTPVFEYVLLSPIADTFLGRPYAGDPVNWQAAVDELGWEGAVRQNARDRIELARVLGHDMIYATLVPPPPDKRPPKPEPPLPETDDPTERVAARNQQAERHSGLTDEMLSIYAVLREEMERAGMDLPILAPAYAHGVWTDVDLMQTMLIAPDVARRHFELATQRSLWRIERYIEIGVDQIGVGGDFSGTHPLISPALYREFIVPEVRKLSRAIHAAGKHAVNASDGNLWPVIDDYLFGCEVDGYLEIDLHAGMEIATLKEKCAGRVTLYGNLDCGNTLSFGSTDDVRTHVTDCLEAGLGGGHILCASNAITASVPLPNYVALVNAYRDFFALPPLRATN